MRPDPGRFLSRIDVRDVGEHRYLVALVVLNVLASTCSYIVAFRRKMLMSVSRKTTLGRYRWQCTEKE